MSEQPPPSSDRPEGISEMLRIGLEAGRKAKDDTAREGPQRSVTTPIGPGKEIGGYRILNEVGRGGMGIVYKAKELALDRVVALKVLGPRIVDDPTAAKRFEREVLRASRVRHPNVVPIYAIDRCSPPRFFAMEFIEGQSLYEKVVQEGALAPEQAVRIATAVCKALNAAHKEKVLHLDIKPSNILLENDIEFVKVTDFGIAQDMGTTDEAVATAAEEPVGTPDFTSPERKYMRKLDARADVFSLGMTLYFMLTATTAELAPHPLGPAFLFKERDYLPPSRLNDTVSGALDQVVLRMIAPCPRHRYRNCEVVLRELDRISSLGQKRPVVSRKATLLAAACVIAAIASMVFLGNVLQDHNQSQPIEPRVVAVEPHHIVFEGSTLTAFGSNGQPIWSIRIDGEITKAFPAGLFRNRPCYVIVGVGGQGMDAGKVMVYDHQGHLAWAKSYAEAYPYNGDADNRMIVQDVIAADLGESGVPDIVIISKDRGKYPCKVSILTREGNERRTYWNPGQLHRLLVFKPSREHGLRILAWGLNNDMRASRRGSKENVNYGAIVCLDPEAMSGEAPPRSGSIGKGSELWYGVILPQGVGISEVKIRPPKPGDPEGTPGQTIQLSLDNSCFLYLDEGGNLLWSAYGDSYTGSKDERIELFK